MTNNCPHDEEFEKDLKRVSDAIIAAKNHYEIYYVLTSSKYRPKYATVLNAYLGFFSASISAQFTAMLLCMSKILDKNLRNGKSLYSLINDAEKKQIINASALNQAKEDLSKATSLYEKLQILRNNQFAHLGNLDSSSAFQKAELSLNDSKQVIEISKKVFSDISYAYNRATYAFNLNSTDDTCRLLDDLLCLLGQRENWGFSGDID
ncbi:MAG: AbiU2 domain-containing protein [Planctomycetota bacterium]|jgi:hypothetical protein